MPRLINNVSFPLFQQFCRGSFRGYCLERSILGSEPVACTEDNCLLASECASNSGAQPPRADNTGSPKLPSFEEVWNFVCNLDVEASGKPSVIMKYICHRFYEYIERQLRAGA